MQRFSRKIEYFPVPAHQADNDGLLAIGGDLSSQRLLRAYRSGIFPWYSADQPILWWSPDPRCVLFPQKYKTPRSLRKSIKRKQFCFSMDRDFRSVIHACASPREKQSGTWIHDEMKQAYLELHSLGVAHSVETWQNNRLVGGLYGLAIGGVFFGESMFSHVSDASKAALSYLVPYLIQWNFKLVDCQVTSPHLLSLGAEEIARPAFLKALESSLSLCGKPGIWNREGATSVAGF